MDMLIRILMLMEPRDAVKLSLACKAWKCLASGNRLGRCETPFSSPKQVCVLVILSDEFTNFEFIFAFDG
jgi:hypothetical protein